MSHWWQNMIFKFIYGYCWFSSKIIVTVPLRRLIRWIIHYFLEFACSQTLYHHHRRHIYTTLFLCSVTLFTAFAYYNHCNYRCVCFSRLHEHAFPQFEIFPIIPQPPWYMTHNGNGQQRPVDVWRLIAWHVYVNVDIGYVFLRSTITRAFQYFFFRL